MNGFGLNLAPSSGDNWIGIVFVSSESPVERKEKRQTVTTTSPITPTAVARAITSTRQVEQDVIHRTLIQFKKLLMYRKSMDFAEHVCAVTEQLYQRLRIPR